MSRLRLTIILRLFKVKKPVIALISVQCSNNHSRIENHLTHTDTPTHTHINDARVSHDDTRCVVILKTMTWLLCPLFSAFLSLSLSLSLSLYLFGLSASIFCVD